MHNEQEYSESELAKIKDVQDLLKRNLSYRHTRLNSARDIGQRNEIDIRKKSGENLKKLKERLRNGTYSSDEDRIQLAKEKAAHALLTPKEIDLFTSLINKDLVLKHTTSASSLEKILASHTMLDPKEIERRGKSSKEATPNFCGVEQNIFFGIGSKQSSLPKFTRTPTNYETKQPEDYATIEINYKKLIETNPRIAQSIWTSGHFAHYLTSSLNAMPFGHLFAALTNPPIIMTLGNSTYMKYWEDKSTEQKTLDVKEISNPKHRTQNKVLTVLRGSLEEIQKNAESVKELEIPLGLDDEISCGKDVLPFIVYSFIERLRLVGGTMREYVLDHPDDQKMIDFLWEQFFRVDDFEVHIPTQLPLAEHYTATFTPQDRKKITEAVSTASAGGDIAALEELFKNDYPLDGYMYEDQYYFDNTPATTFPLVAAIKAGQFTTMKWLLEHGAHDSIFRMTEEKTDNLKSATPDQYKSDFKIIIEAAFTSKNPEIISYLVQHGLLDFYNAAFVLCDGEDIYQDLQEYSEPLEWIAAVLQPASNESLGMLDIVLDHFSYAKDAKIQNGQLIYDAASCCSVEVFEYLLKKYPQDEAQINYTHLFSAAAKNDNLQILPYLFNKTIDKPSNEAIYSLALKQLGKGHIQTGEWLLEKSGRTPSSLSDQDIYVLLSDTYENIQEISKWLLNKVDVRPTATFSNPMSLYSSTFDKYDVTLITQLVKHKCNDYAKEVMEQYQIKPDHSLAGDNSPMIQALKSENLGLANDFLAQGTAIPKDKSLLKYLIKEAKTDSLQWLIDRGISVFDKETISTAITEGQIKILKMPGIDKSKFPDASHAKELYTGAIKANEVSMLEWLEEHYPFDPKEHHEQLLELLVEKIVVIDSNMEVIHWMLAHGCDMQQTDASGQTLFDHLLSAPKQFGQKNIKVLRLLQEHGVNINTGLKEKGTNLLMCAISSDAGNSLWNESGLAYLLEKGMALNTVFTRGGPRPVTAITPLEYASSLNGNPETVKALLEAGADASFTPNEDATALHYACGLSLGENKPYALLGKESYEKSGQVEIIKLLLAAHAPVNIGKESPLAILYKQKNPPQEAIDLLLKAGAIPVPREAVVDHSEDKPVSNPVAPKDERDTDVEINSNQHESVSATSIEENNSDSDSEEECDSAQSAPSTRFEEKLATANPSSFFYSPDIKVSPRGVKRIFITAAPKDESYAETGTGDIDYANVLAQILQEHCQENIIVNANDCKEESSLFAMIRKQTLPGEQPVLQVLVNAPNTGFMLSPASLDRFKKDGGQVVITVLEFAKNKGRRDGKVLSNQILNFIEKADRVIFLDENDRQSAERYVLGKRKLPPTSVISVPATVPVSHTQPQARGKDIISFGMIRQGKGLAHLQKLAQLIKESNDPVVNSKKILIVGKVAQYLQDKMFASLKELMKAMYPDHATPIDRKTPAQLVELQKELSNNKDIKPALPIEFHFNVPEQDLQTLFDRCTYSYLPAYRGATLRNTSISTSIANSFVTYVHEGKITPKDLLPGGEHAQSIVLIEYDKERKFYEYSADFVLEDITLREKDPSLNQAKQEAANKLVNAKLSSEVVAAQHLSVYQAIRSEEKLKTTNSSSFFFRPNVRDNSETTENEHSNTHIP